MMLKMLKYPRTAHLQGSALQFGDSGSDQVRYADLAGKWIVVEEKMDGANAGLRFDGEAQLWLQSRGHFLQGGAREKHFALFKTWANAHDAALYAVLADRYYVFGEWMFAKHTVFYDALPHYFLEFDVFDLQKQCFLSTPARRELLKDLPIVSVPVLYEGVAPRHLKDLLALIGESTAKTSTWRTRLETVAKQTNQDPLRVLAETESSDLMEGLYLKIETPSETIGRLKWVRADFLQTIVDNDSHWHSRPIIPNQLRAGVDIFSEGGV